MTTGSDPSAGIASIIQQIHEQKEAAEEEFRRVKQISLIQDELIQKQRQTLTEIAETSFELEKVEQQRSALKQKLASQKSQLLVAASESSDLYSLINEAIDSEPPLIASSSAGSAALKAIEEIQKDVFALTETCLQSSDFTIPQDSLTDVILSANNLIRTIVQNGNATESSEDTIRRQSFLISSLISPPEDVE